MKGHATFGVIGLRSQAAVLFKVVELLPKITNFSWFYILNSSWICPLLQTLWASPFFSQAALLHLRYMEFPCHWSHWFWPYPSQPKVIFQRDISELVNVMLKILQCLFIIVQNYNPHNSVPWFWTSSLTFLCLNLSSEVGIIISCPREVPFVKMPQDNGWGALRTVLSPWRGFLNERVNEWSTMLPIGFCNCHF